MDPDTPTNKEFYCFPLLQKVNFGEGHKIVGNVAELGQWDVERAPSMAWNDGSLWTLDLEMPVGSNLEFKVGQMMQQNTSAGMAFRLDPFLSANSCSFNGLNPEHRQR